MSLRNPVRYPVKYYSWQDDQAPQLSDADGVIKTILKACLVTGYGSKAGAGWTSLFEDAYRIVLRRPLRTGNPPDIKIENGTFAVNGSNVTRHRIVAQDNPTGLDDTTELSAVNLLARDSRAFSEWYCIATDFGFVLLYQMSGNQTSNNRNHLLYIGSVKNIKSNDIDRLLAGYHAGINVNGIANANSLYGFLDANHGLYDLRNKINYIAKQFLTVGLSELEVDNDYVAQKIIVDKIGEMPFFCALNNSYSDMTTKQVNINSRPMLRYVNLQGGSYANVRPLYIPLDYWEL